MKTAIIAAIAVYIVVGIVIFVLAATLSTLTGHSPDYKGACIAAFGWPYWFVVMIVKSI